MSFSDPKGQARTDVARTPRTTKYFLPVSISSVTSNGSSLRETACEPVTTQPASCAITMPAWVYYQSRERYGDVKEPTQTSQGLRLKICFKRIAKDKIFKEIHRQPISQYRSNPPCATMAMSSAPLPIALSHHNAISHGCREARACLNRPQTVYHASALNARRWIAYQA
jgi:hypothetical protein